MSSQMGTSHFHRPQMLIFDYSDCYPMCSLTIKYLAMLGNGCIIDIGQTLSDIVALSLDSVHLRLYSLCES